MSFGKSLLVISMGILFMIFNQAAIGWIIIAIVPIGYAIEAVQRRNGADLPPKDHLKKKCQCGKYIHHAVARVWDGKMVCPDCYSRLKAEREAESTAYVNAMLDARRTHDPSAPPPRGPLVTSVTDEQVITNFCTSCGTERFSFENSFCQECGEKFDN